MHTGRNISFHLFMCSRLADKTIQQSSFHYVHYCTLVRFTTVKCKARSLIIYLSFMLVVAVVAFLFIRLNSIIPRHTVIKLLEKRWKIVLIEIRRQGPNDCYAIYIYTSLNKHLFNFFLLILIGIRTVSKLSPKTTKNERDKKQTDTNTHTQNVAWPGMTAKQGKDINYNEQVSCEYAKNV